MSLAEAFKDGREFRRLLSGGYEEDLRQQKELKQAQIAESRQRTQASKDRIALAQKSEDRIRRNQLFMNLVNNKITPEITDMKNRNASQSEYDLYSDKLLEDYPDIMSLYGEKGMRFKKRNKEIEFDMTVNITAEDLPKYGISENSLPYKSMLKKIKNGGGSASFIISGDESGKLQIGSPGQRHLETIIKDPNATPEDIQQAIDIANNIFKKETDNGKEVDGENLVIQSLRFIRGLIKGNTPNDKSVAENKESESTSITKSENAIQSKETRYKIGDTISKRSGDYKYKGGDPELGSSWDKI